MTWQKSTFYDFKLLYIQCTSITTKWGRRSRREHKLQSSRPWLTLREEHSLAKTQSRERERGGRKAIIACAKSYQLIIIEYIRCPFAAFSANYHLYLRRSFRYPASMGRARSKKQRKKRKRIHNLITRRFIWTEAIGSNLTYHPN